MLWIIAMTCLLIINALGLILMLTDKIKARRGAWRIPEATLMGIAAIGGSIGVLGGMYLFRHKTKHPKFSVGVPVILLVQLGIVGYLWYTGILF